MFHKSSSDDLLRLPIDMAHDSRTHTFLDVLPNFVSRQKRDNSLEMVRIIGYDFDVTGSRPRFGGCQGKFGTTGNNDYNRLKTIPFYA
jgi:hypothetical protein